MLHSFLPMGNTILIKGTTTASAAQQTTGSGGVSGCQVFTQSTALMLVAFGVSTATAALPTTSAPALGTPIVPNAINRFQTPISFFVSVIASTAGGTADVYITPGQGV